MSRHKDVQYGFADLSPSFNPWLVLAGPMSGATAQLTAKICEGVTEISKELADFTARRVQEDIKLPERLVKCRSPQDVQQVYLGFWATAFAQYQAEFGRLTELNQAIGRVAAATFGQTVDKASQLRIAA